MEQVEPVAIPLAPEPDPFWTYRDLLILFLFAVPAFLAGSLVWSAVYFTSGLFNEDGSKGLRILPAQFLGYAIWFLLLGLWWRGKYNRPFWASIHWFLPSRLMLPAMTSGLVLAVSTALLGTLLKAPNVDSPMLELVKDPVSLMMLGAAAVTIGPIFEEVVFRGLLLPLLARSLGTLAAILITSTLFGLMHGAQYAWSWQHVLLVGTAGAAFAWARVRTGSTAVSALMHACYNFTIFFALIASQRGILND